MIYFRQIGKSKNVRNLIKELVTRIGKIESDQNPIEIKDFTQITRSNNDTIGYVCTVETIRNFVVLDPGAKQYQMPMEPDADKLTCWLKFLRVTSLGQYVDDSGFKNSAILDSGSPTTSSGPVSGLPSLQFNGQDTTIAVPDAPTINTQTAASSTGFSVSFNLNPTSLADHGGKHRIIACKTDDLLSSRQWGWIIWLEPNGNLYFHVRIANTFHTASKTFAFAALNRWYKIFCTFNRSTNTPRIYIDGVLSTESKSTYVGGLVLPDASNHLYIGSNDIPGQSYLSGSISDFRFWREKVVSQSEIDNIQANGYSISFTLFPARVGVGNFASVDPASPGGEPQLPPPPPPPAPNTLRSFTNASFTTTSFASA